MKKETKTKKASTKKGILPVEIVEKPIEIIEEPKEEAKQQIDYIYNHDKLWDIKDISITEPTKPGIIVTNVKKTKDNEFEFNIKGDKKKYSCAYGWAFIKNTPENRVLFNKYITLKNVTAKYKEACENIMKEMETL